MRFLVAVQTANASAGRAASRDATGGFVSCWTLAESLVTELFRTQVPAAKSLFASFSTAAGSFWTSETLEFSALVVLDHVRARNCLDRVLRSLSAWRWECVPAAVAAPASAAFASAAAADELRRIRREPG